MTNATLNVYYDKSTKLWVAYYTDSIGQLGDAEYAHDRDNAIFALGLELGRHPEKFSRPMGQIMDSQPWNHNAPVNPFFAGAERPRLGKDY